MAGTYETAQALELVRTRSLPDLVQEEIIRMIREGELSMGDKLNESVLAATLGVSRGPVREAFQGLVESGILRQERNRGVFVRTPYDQGGRRYLRRAGVPGPAGGGNCGPNGHGRPMSMASAIWWRAWTRRPPKGTAKCITRSTWISTVGFGN